MNTTKEKLTCPICLEEFDESSSSSSSSIVNDSSNNQENKMFQGRCGHILHAHCIHDSMRIGIYTCPICRQPFGEISTSSNELPQPDKRLIRYTRMLKSNLPPAAVRQRMIVDGISPIEIDSFFTGGVSLSVQSTEDLQAIPTSNLTAITEEKYRKMLRIGMDVEIVKQKMIMDGCLNDEIEVFIMNYFN